MRQYSSRPRPPSGERHHCCGVGGNGANETCRKPAARLDVPRIPQSSPAISVSTPLISVPIPPLYALVLLPFLRLFAPELVIRLCLLLLLLVVVLPRVLCFD